MPFIVLTLVGISACRDERQPAPIRRGGGPRITASAPVAPEPNLKVAFIGDSGNGEGFKAVLNLIKAEGADFVMHQGDMNQEDLDSTDPDGFFATIDSVLGLHFPFLAVPGNHDYESWPEGCGDPDGCYAAFLKQRMSRLGITPDHPDLDDEMYSVEYKGLKMVFVGQDRARNGDCGSDPQGYACYVRNQLADDNHIWKICSWHKNAQTMQVGGNNDMGLDVYESCRNEGAIIATAHMHGYQRTKTLLSMRHPIVDPVAHPLVDGVPSNPNSVRVASGATFLFVSGLGGKSARRQERCLPATYPFGCNQEWAAIYTETQMGGDENEKFGALFIEFNVDGDPYKARGYFKTTDRKVIDAFDITAAAPAPARVEQ